MKKLTLNQTWTLCLRMWKWIASVWKDGNDVFRLKRQWLRKNGYELWNDCFFCEWAVEQRPGGKLALNSDNYIKGGGCIKYCPGTEIDKEFNCENIAYHYGKNPKAFYAELLRLNRIRKDKP